MTTRIGKIGRLPKSIRDELGQRIEDGSAGTELVQWLNEQKQVQEVLARFFEGRPVNEQNLSDWKQSGHLEWVRRQEACGWAQRVSEEADDMDQATGDSRLTDAMALVLAAQIGQLAPELTQECANVKERWARLRELNRELSVLRRDQDRRERTKLQMNWRQWQMDREDEIYEKAQKKEHCKEQVAMLVDRHLMEDRAELMGSVEAERVYRIKWGLNQDDLNDGTWEAKEAARQEEIQAFKRQQKAMKAKTQKPKADADGESKVENGEQATAQPQPRVDLQPSTPKENENAEIPEKANESGVIKPNKDRKKVPAEKRAVAACRPRRTASVPAAPAERQRSQPAAIRLIKVKAPEESIQEESRLVKQAESQYSAVRVQQPERAATNPPGRKTGVPTESSHSPNSEIQITKWERQNWETEEDEPPKPEDTQKAELSEDEIRAGAVLGTPGPRWTAREIAYHTWLRMTQKIIPYDDDVLDRLWEAAGLK